MKEGRMHKTPTNQTDRNFPMMMSEILMGCEKSQFKVPDCSSSANVFMETAGMMNSNSQGAKTK